MPTCPHAHTCTRAHTHTHTPTHPHTYTRTQFWKMQRKESTTVFLVTTGGKNLSVVRDVFLNLSWISELKRWWSDSARKATMSAPPGVTSQLEQLTAPPGVTTQLEQTSQEPQNCAGPACRTRLGRLDWRRAPLCRPHQRRHSVCRHEGSLPQSLQDPLNSGDYSQSRVQDAMTIRYICFLLVL